MSVARNIKDSCYQRMYNIAVAGGGHVFTRWSTLVKKKHQNTETEREREKERDGWERENEGEWTKLTEENVFHAHLNKHKTTAL